MTMGTQASDFELVDPPHDGISTVTFSPTDPDLLLVSSWDKVNSSHDDPRSIRVNFQFLTRQSSLQSVRLYNVSANKSLSRYEHKAAVLDCCFAATDTVYSGGLDRRLKRYTS
jgi:cell cycle arrest protein BUB3